MYTNKKVSIILPTYNGEKFLRESIESCLGQTYSNIELIVVNDCSNDSSLDIIQSFEDDRLVVVTNEENQKLPRSLNIGFSKASGEYLTWTSDDNYYLPNAIEVMVHTLDKENADLVYAHYNTIDESGQITGNRKVGNVEDILIDNVVRACFLYKTSVHLTLDGYNPDLFLVEDYDFWIRAAKAGFTFHPINNVLYHYRFHDGSLTEKRRKEIAKALLKLISHHLNDKNSEEFISDKLYLRLAKLYKLNGQTGSQRKSAWKAFELNPMVAFSIHFYKSMW